MSEDASTTVAPPTEAAEAPAAPPQGQARDGAFGAPLSATEMSAVMAASGIGSAAAPAAPAAPSTAAAAPQPYAPPTLDPSAIQAPAPGATTLDLLADVTLDVKVELGRAQMLVEDVLKLGSGSVVELDKLVGDPVDIYVNERLVARGEVLVLNDEFCVRISEIITPAA